MLNSVLFIAILMLPTSILALTCNPNDIACKTEQAELQALENAGVKPTETTNFLIAPQKTVKPIEYQQIPPFKIPTPNSEQATSQQTQAQTDTSTTTNTQPQEKPFVNIFSSDSGTTKTHSNNQQQSSTYQNPSSTNQPPTGIYR